MVADNCVVLGDNLDVLPTFPDGSFQMIYVDPPFNTGKQQLRRTLATEADAEGDRTGFGGRRYATKLLQESSYLDEFADYLAFLEPRLRHGRRVLAMTGTLYFHIDYREVHYCKLLLDRIFGRASFINEIIWAYDYGARTKSRWPAKHDTSSSSPRTRRVLLRRRRGRPHRVHGARARRRGEGRGGKLPTDTWWHTIVTHRPRKELATRPRSRADRPPDGAGIHPSGAIDASTSSRVAEPWALSRRRQAAASF